MQDEFCTFMQLEYAEKEDSYFRSKEVSPCKCQMTIKFPGDNFDTLVSLAKEILFPSFQLYWPSQMGPMVSKFESICNVFLSSESV